MTSESDNIGIRLDKLDKKQLVADYLDLRSNNLQSAADFFLEKRVYILAISCLRSQYGWSAEHRVSGDEC